MQLCPDCHTTNRSEARFCESCGTALNPPPDIAAHAAINTGPDTIADPTARAESFNQQAILAIARGELPEALELINSALSVAPDHVPAIRTRVDILRRIGLTSQAEVEANRIATLERGGVDYAGFWQRFGAHFLDSIFAGLLALPPAIIIGAVVYTAAVPGNPTTVEEDDALNTASYFGYAVYGAITLVYYWLGNGWGGTWGKRAFGIRVVGLTDGHQIGLGRSFVRFLVSLVGGGLVYIGWLWMLWDDRKQTWHDRAAGSIVVKKGG